ncbi:MAG TPA: hypothetical protein VNU68_35330 [Verrucomicrobiae bacterium]|nr:hypothetical protein [Verrucomicrobiae bacterium]
MTNRTALARGSVRYHGEVFRRSGDFLKIEGETGGYAPIVTITVQMDCGEINLWLQPEEASELARHLTNAKESIDRAKL